MPYKITITKMIDNPKFEQELREYNESVTRGYGHLNRDVTIPEKQIEVRSLVTVVTDEEFDKIRNACFSSV